MEMSFTLLLLGRQLSSMNGAPLVAAVESEEKRGCSLRRRVFADFLCERS